MVAIRAQIRAMNPSIAVVGLYGIISYAVSRRTHEIGIRLVLGARLAQVRRLVFTEALVPVAVGVVGGVTTSLWLSRVLESRLFQVAPNDPRVLAGIVVVLLAACALAVVVPVRRATRTGAPVAPNVSSSNRRCPSTRRATTQTRASSGDLAPMARPAEAGYYVRAALLVCRQYDSSSAVPISETRNASRKVVSPRTPAHASPARALGNKCTRGAHRGRWTAAGTGISLRITELGDSGRRTIMRAPAPANAARIGAMSTKRS